VIYLYFSNYNQQLRSESDKCFFRGFVGVEENFCLNF